MSSNTRSLPDAEHTRYACIWLNVRIVFTDYLARAKSCQHETNTVEFQLDPLSRRSLLVHMPDAQCPTLYLSSVRSGLSRQQGVEFRALDGGEGGILNMKLVTAAGDNQVGLSVVHQGFG